MIQIRKSATADTRTCDVLTVSKATLAASSREHIDDVGQAITFFIANLKLAASYHDYTKLSDIDGFFHDFRTGFKVQEWWKMHQREERHHIDNPEGVRDDVNLFDVLEHVADCVMAGMGRAGSVYPMAVSADVLIRAVQNTADLLKSQIEVIK